MRTMNTCLNNIDEILKRECIFCGPILIDMIDNDIDENEGGLASDLKAGDWEIN